MGGTLTLGITRKASASFTRPSDTNTYTINDEVSNDVDQADAVALTFANVVGKPTGAGYVVGGKLVVSGDTVANGNFRLWLFTAAPTMVGDQNAYGLLNTLREEIVGYLDFTLETEDTTAGNTAVAFNYSSRIPFVNTTTRHLYGVLVAEAAFVASSAQTFYLDVFVECND
jgi:hypothetical protein